MKRFTKRRRASRRGGIIAKSNAAVKVRGGRSLKRRLADNWQLYLLLIIPILVTVIYKYGSMYGIAPILRTLLPSRKHSGSRTAVRMIRLGKNT